MSAHEDDEVEVLRAAVTEASCSSAAALGRVQDALYAFRARLAAAFVAPSLQQHFEGVLDVADEEMTRLNAGTRALAARIRASGSVVHETAGRSAGAGAAPAAAGALPPPPPQPQLPPPPAALEQSAVGRATSVPLGELQAMLDGLEAGHVRHVLAMGSSSSSAYRSPSPAKRLPPPPPLPQHAAPMATTSFSASTAAAGAGGADAASISLLLQQLASIRSTYASTHRGASPARAPAAPAVGLEALDALAHSPSAGATSSASALLAAPPPPQPPPPPFDSGAAAALQKLKQERRELEIELLQAHKAIGALQSRLVGR